MFDILVVVPMSVKLLSLALDPVLKKVWFKTQISYSGWQLFYKNWTLKKLSWLDSLEALCLDFIETSLDWECICMVKNSENGLGIAKYFSAVLSSQIYLAKKALNFQS